jgi:DNA-directed RNA polymerase subunit beta
MPVKQYDDRRSSSKLAEQLRRACRSRRRCSTVPVEADINDAAEQAGLNQSGQSTLYDGRTGEPSTVR